MDVNQPYASICIRIPEVLQDAVSIWLAIDIVRGRASTAQCEAATVYDGVLPPQSYRNITNGTTLDEGEHNLQ